MGSKNLKKGIYFDGDIEMSASALMTSFGAEAETNVSSRLQEVRKEQSAEGIKFWEAVLVEIKRRRKKEYRDH